MGKHACNTQEGNVGDMRMYKLQILLQYSTVSFKTSHVGRSVTQIHQHALCAQLRTHSRGVMHPSFHPWEEQLW